MTKPATPLGWRSIWAPGTPSFRLSAAEACAVIPELPRIWDEPFADELQIPTLLVSRLARQHVTVALTGDGGDESFGGYARHFAAPRLAFMLGLPLAPRRAAASALLMLGSETWERLLRAVPLPAVIRRGLSGRKLAQVLGAADERELLRTADIARGGDNAGRSEGWRRGCGSTACQSRGPPDVPRYGALLAGRHSGQA